MSPYQLMSQNRRRIRGALACVLVAFCLGTGGVLLAEGAPASGSAAQTPKLIEHLQLLGFTVEMRGEAILAKHSQYLNMLIKPSNSGYFVRAFWVGKKGKDYGLEFLKFSNLLNKEAEFNRYYIDDDGDLIAEAGSSVVYERVSFGAFLTAFNSDFQSAIKKHPDLLKEHIK